MTWGADDHELDYYSQSRRRRFDLNPDTLRFTRLEVEGFRALRSVEMNFYDHNVIVGANGAGKTTVLNLLATIAGSDRATEILADEKIGRIAVEMSHKGQSYRYEVKDTLTRDGIEAFKSSLPMGKRANYALPESRSERYSFGCCDIATLEDRMKTYLKKQPSALDHRYSPRWGVGLPSGDGARHSLRLIICSAMGSGPLLMDMPETHLDYGAKSMVARMIQSEIAQTISVTHCPEWLTQVENRISI